MFVITHCIGIFTDLNGIMITNTWPKCNLSCIYPIRQVYYWKPVHVHTILYELRYQLHVIPIHNSVRCICVIHETIFTPFHSCSVRIIDETTVMTREMPQNNISNSQIKSSVYIHTRTHMFSVIFRRITVCLGYRKKKTKIVIYRIYAFSYYTKLWIMLFFSSHINTCCFDHVARCFPSSYNFKYPYPLAAHLSKTWYHKEFCCAPEKVPVRFIHAFGSVCLTQPDIQQIHTLPHCI